LISDNKNNNQLAKVVGYSFPVILTVLFLYFAFKGIDLGKSFNLIVHSSVMPLVLYIIFFFLSHYARAIRWKLMLQSLKSDASLNHLFGSVMVGYGVNCVIPRLGEVYRGLFLGRWEGMSRSTVIGTIVVERIIDIASFTFAALISVTIYSGNLYNEITWLKTSLIIGCAFIFLSAFFLIFLVRFKEKFRNGLLKIAGRFSEKFSDRLKIIFDTLVRGFSSIQGTKIILKISFWSVAIMFLYVLNAQVGFYVLGMESTGKVNFEMAWIVMTIGSFSAMIPTPGQVGSYHAISIFVLTQLFKFDNESSAAYAILTNFISIVAFIASTIIAIFFANRGRIKNGLKKETFLSVFKINPEEK
jgi:glycosyltransferase 2 family protein